jgi:hypothetical protein
MLRVEGSRELQAVILALKLLDKTLRPELYKRTREKILPEWRDTIMDNLSRDGFPVLESRLILKNTKVSVGTQGISLGAATSVRKAVSGGLKPSQDYYLAEFGADPRVAEIKGRRGTTTYYYKRMINTGFKRRTQRGRYAYKAGAEIAARAVALWVESVVQIVYESFEKGER